MLSRASSGERISVHGDRLPPSALSSWLHVSPQTSASERSLLSAAPSPFAPFQTDGPVHEDYHTLPSPRTVGLPLMLMRHGLQGALESSNYEDVDEVEPKVEGDFDFSSFESGSANEHSAYTGSTISYTVNEEERATPQRRGYAKRSKARNSDNTEDDDSADEGSFQCRECRKVFQKLSALKRHARTHTGERPFRCNLCQLAFAERGNLKRHQKVHSGEKPFHCKRCGKGFARRCHLLQHQSAKQRRGACPRQRAMAERWDDTTDEDSMA